MRPQYSRSLVFCMLVTAAVVLAQTPPPKIAPSDEPPGKEAQKDGTPGASWSEASKHDKQKTDGSGGNAAPAYARQKAADRKTDGGPVVIPPTPAKPD